MDRKYLLRVGNRLVFDQSTRNLIHLTQRVNQIVGNLIRGDLTHPQRFKGRRGPRNKLTAQFQVGLDLAHIAPPTGIAHPIERLPYFPKPILALAPALNFVHLTGVMQRAEQAAHRVLEQVHIRGPMHVGLGYRRIYTTLQRGLRLYVQMRVPALHDRLVDLQQNPLG